MNKDCNAFQKFTFCPQPLPFSNFLEEKNNGARRLYFAEEILIADNCQLTLYMCTKEQWTLKRTKFIMPKKLNQTKYLSIGWALDETEALETKAEPNWVRFCLWTVDFCKWVLGKWSEKRRRYWRRWEEERVCIVPNVSNEREKKVMLLYANVSLSFSLLEMEWLLSFRYADGLSSFMGLSFIRFFF